MPYFLRDGQWQDIANDTVDHGGSGWTDEAGNYWSASGDLVRTGDSPVAMSGGANVNDPNRSFAPSVLSAQDQAGFSNTHGTPFEWLGGATPEGQTFKQYADYLYANGLAGQEPEEGGVAGYLRSHGYMVPLAAMAAFGGLAAAGAAEAGAGAGALDSSAAAAGGAGGGGAFVPTAGSSFALPASTVGAAAGGTASINPSATLGMGGTGGAASPLGIAATQSSLGLGGSGTGIIEGLTPSSVGMGGTAGAGSLPGIAGSQAAAGLGGSYLGTGLTAQQLADYEAGYTSSPTSTSGLSDAAKLAKSLLSGQAASAATNAVSKLAAGFTPQGQAITGVIRGNQNPFSYSPQQSIQDTKPNLASLAQLLRQG